MEFEVYVVYCRISDALCSDKTGCILMFQSFWNAHDYVVFKQDDNQLDYEIRKFVLNTTTPY